jgi:hypothetical protein
LSDTAIWAGPLHADHAPYSRKCKYLRKPLVDTGYIKILNENAARIPVDRDPDLPDDQGRDQGAVAAPRPTPLR